MANQPENYGLGTLALHAGQSDDSATHACAVPIYATASYNFTSTEHAAELFALKEPGNIYSRLTNPTNDVLEKRLAALDGSVGALCFASGQAAITAAVLTLAHAGENFLASKSLYGGTTTLFSQTFKKFGVEARFFDASKPEQIAALADGNTRCVYLESVGNPKNDVPDFRAIAEAAHSLGVPVIVDNTVTTPMLFRPMEHGADIVVYSTTKFIGGHGVHVGGAVVDCGTFQWAEAPQRWPDFAAPDPAYHGLVFTEALKPLGNLAYIVHMRTHWLRDTGACMSPFAAFLFLLGLETLHLRMPRHCDNALAVAKWLAAHPAVAWVNYPGLPGHPDQANVEKYLPRGAGAIMGFGIKGGKESGRVFIDNVRLAKHLANIGDAKTLVIQPATTTHQQLTDEEQLAAGVTPEFIRLSVGLEDLADILADLDQALRKAVDCAACGCAGGQA
ncbi:MAG: aminotransferase class I/II-fold pyridoxal phosphate-dependent enzyme [Humidesulfovibrio sp.]|nr:aminotransferase class I/II-fold pyridoxal phosphate-dependent enzyme [Humidesulfovibrio sp.]